MSIKLKFTCISDTHNQLDWLNLAAGDVLIHAGDLTLRGTLPELEQAARQLSKLDYKYKIVIAGNHDFAFQIKPQEARQIFSKVPGLIYLEDNFTEIEGIKIYGSPWQPKFFAWAFNLERGAEIKEKWALIPNDIDILITHGPPHGILDQTLRADHAGCEELLKAIQTRIKPRYHIFGHIHEGYGQYQDLKTGTVHINASICNRYYAPINKPIVFEMQSRPSKKP